MDRVDLINGILKAGKHEGGLTAGIAHKVDNFENLKKECLQFHSDWLAKNNAEYVIKVDKELESGKFYKTYVIWLENDDVLTNWPLYAPGLDYSKRKFPFPDRYPALADFLNSVPDLMSARINVMGPGLGEFYHSENVVFRHNDQITMNLLFHIPIATNDECTLNADRDIHKFSEEGRVYYFNQSTIHSPRNPSNETRTHLCFYCLLTERVLEWAKNLQPLTPFAKQELPTDLRKLVLEVPVEDHIYEKINIVPSLI